LSQVPTWLQRAPSPAAAGRVFCIPQAGCGTAVFGAWPRTLGGVEFLPVELPGRLARFGERMPSTYQELAAGMADGLWPYLDVPFAFFGHCWSAIAAYEVTARLERAGAAPAALFISAEVAPQLGPYGPMLDMDRDTLRAELEQTIRGLGQTPHPELVTIYLDVLRADIGLRRRYTASTPLRLDCPITTFAWSEDDLYRPGDLAGWAECGDTRFEVFPGPHLRFADAPAELLGVLATGLGVTASGG